MTMTSNDRVARAMHECREMRAIAGELPNPDEVAAPVVRAMNALYSAFDQHRDALREVLAFELTGADEAEVMEYATAMVACATEVASLITAGVKTSLPYEERLHVEPMRSIVLTLTGAEDIDAKRQSERVRRFVYPD